MRWRRPLTGLERWHWLIGRATGRNLVLVATVRGQVEPHRLSAAMQAIRVRYPHLGSIVETEPEPAFVTTDAPLPLDVVPWEPGAWRATALAQSTERIPTSEAPPLRATLLAGDDRSDLVVAFHRAVADGVSGSAVLEDMLRIHGGEAHPAVAADEVLAPPAEMLAGSRWAAFLTSRRLARQGSRMDVLSPLESAPLETSPREGATNAETGLIDAALDGAAVDELGRRARSHGTTVHGTLCAALLQAIREDMRKYEGRADVFLGCDTPVDLRRPGDLRPAAAGNLVSHALTGHRVHEHTLLFDLAAEISEAIRAAVREGEVFDLARRAEAAGRHANDGRRFANRLKKRARAAAIVANLGRLDFFERYGDLRLERISVVESSGIQGTRAICLGAASVGPTSSLSFTYDRALVGDDRARRIVDDTIERLTEAFTAHPE